MSDIDPADYAAGRASFAAGGTILQVLMRIREAGKSRDPAEEERAVRFALGFADAALDAIRAALNPEDA